MLIANAWLTFMMTRRRRLRDGRGDQHLGRGAQLHLDADQHPPPHRERRLRRLDRRRAYAAVKFLRATTDEERAHYDWMGYIGNFVAICAFLPLPFAGYYLASEIYAYSQTLGITMMGGAFSWLFIIQAVLIGNLFLGANYYLWLGMGRVHASRALPELHQVPADPGRAVLRGLGDAALDHRDRLRDARDGRGLAPAARLPRRDVRQEHGGQHPDPHHLRELPALPPHRAARRPSPGPRLGNALQVAIALAAAAIVIFLGVSATSSRPRCGSGSRCRRSARVLFAMISVTVIDVLMYRQGAEAWARPRWGRIHPISQYVLIFLAVTFTWLMGLMGYVRSGLRQHWHVYGVMRDTSPDAFTPTLGFATQVVSVTVLVFFLLIGFVFWLASLSDKHGPRPSGRAREGPACR